MGNCLEGNGLKVGKSGLGLIGLGASQAGNGDKVMDRGLKAEPGHLNTSSLSVPSINPIMASLTLGVSRRVEISTLGGLGLATSASESQVPPTFRICI